MNCDFQEISPGIFQCQRPECGMQNRIPLRVMPKSQCRAFAEENSNLASIQANGPTRTDAEVQHIITAYCESCPAWQPAAKKKKCKFCGCGATDTIENLHRRRIRNCPKGHWTEADIAQLTPSKNGLDS